MGEMGEADTVLPVQDSAVSMTSSIPETSVHCPVMLSTGAASLGYCMCGREPLAGPQLFRKAGLIHAVVPSGSFV